ncbi:MAG: NAD-binding protein, partial [Halodesulfurarchaeum sp.]
DDLQRATIDRASVLITDAGDRTASIVLTAREINEDLRVISFTESTRRKAALREIGVDRSVAPHVLIGQRLAEMTTLPVTVEAQFNGGAIEVREVLIRRGSSLQGVRVHDSPIVSHPRLTLVAGWFDGELRLPPALDDRLTLNTVLVVAGPADIIDELTNEVSGVQSRQFPDHSQIIVAGYSEGGHAAVDALPADRSVTSVDESVDTKADIVGDVTEPETLQQAEIATASALIVTVNDDSTALLTTAMARSLSSEIEILVRVTDAEKVKVAFRAGADYVLSSQRVSARLVAAEVHGERVMDPTSQIRLVRVEATSFVGESLADARMNTERGWTIVGVSRNGTVHTDESITIEVDDEVFIAGSDNAIQEFEKTVDSA